MSENNVKTVENSKMKKLGFKELYAISIGTVIGAGVFNVLGSAIAQTGKSVWLAYIVAVILGLIVNMPFWLMSSMATLKGGQYSMVAGLLDRKWAGMFLIGYIPTSFSYALFGLGLGQYVNSLFPTINAKWAGVAVITFFFILNLFDVSKMAKLQKIMTWILIGTLFMFILFGLPQVNGAPFDFGAQDYFLKGGTGFLTAVILLVYSCTSYIQVTNYGGMAVKPKKTLPKVILLSACTILVVYAGAAIVASGILPISEVVGQPLTFVARVVLPKPLFFVLILGGVVMALATTLNSMFGSFGRIYAQGCEDGWFGGILAKRNKNGAPYILLAISWLIGIVPIIIDFDIATVTNNIVLLTYAMGLLPRFALMMFPKKYPQVLKQSKTWNNPKKYHFANIFSLIVQIVIMVLAAKALNPVIVACSLGALALCGVFAFWRDKTGKVNVADSFDVNPDVD